MDRSLDNFHPLVRKWFLDKYRDPTPIQSAAWPDIEKGKHCLLSAPTGSGKTMAAFLSALNALISGKWPGGTTRVLYISPLKALNNDIQQNLTLPLRELKALFESEGEPFPEIKVGVRSGDTAQKDRRRMRKRPPEILITTPESMNLLLSSPMGRNILTGIQAVILDEIHALIQEKRGTHLITGVERITLLAGEFQRIALSATLNPLSLAADFTGGYSFEDGGTYRKRDVIIHRTTEGKNYDVRVDFPDIPPGEISADIWWEELIRSLTGEIEKNKSTLLFANSRRLVEKITRLINSCSIEKSAWSHHGSLSRELRLLVEEKLKSGALKAIVATNSLELGIDIGELDQVILLQAPDTISSALQKTGRAGHGVNQTSRGTFYPLHSGDLLPMAVCAGEMLEGNIEKASVPATPLDVLAQVILSMTIVDKWDIDRLYDFVKTAWPYRDLSRKLFDSVIKMLSGRYEDSRIRELSSRVYIDPVENTIIAREGQSFPLYLSGGTIPDRGYYTLRLRDTGARIGELDEEFVWERSIGDHFLLGTMSWKITSIGEQDVEVAASGEKGAMAPFWKGDTRGRTFSFSEKIGFLLEELDSNGEENSIELLTEKYLMTEKAAGALLDYLERQTEACSTGLPHRHRIILENYSDPFNNRDLKQVIIHNFWGGRVNRPFAMLLRQAWEDEFGYPLYIYDDEDSLIINLPHEMDPETLLDRLKPGKTMELLKKRLEMTGYFGARFRENAGRALLLPKKGFGSRTPLWLNRLRSKKLLASVMKYPDFPITLETWRSCLNDDFDLKALELLLWELEEGMIEIVQCRTEKPSPFSSGNLFQQTNVYMYQDDTPDGRSISATSESLFSEIMSDAEFRPLIPGTIIDSFQKKMARTAEGYSPENREGLLALLQERLLLPVSEWEQLKDSIRRDNGEDIYNQIIPLLEKRIITDPFLVDETEKPTNFPIICLKEDLERLNAARSSAINDKNYEDLSLLTNEILAFYGPVSMDFLMNLWNTDEIPIRELTGTMEGEERILSGLLSEDGKSKDVLEFCRKDNFEILLRMLRKSRRPEFTTLPGSSIPLFLGINQGLTWPGEKNRKDIRDILNTLLLYPARFMLWETEILPARLSPYFSSWIDSVSAETDIQFTGFPGEKMAFCFPMDRDLLTAKPENPSDLIPGNSGYHDFWELKERFSGSTGDLTARVWEEFFEGKISNSSFAALRKGALSKWKTGKTADPSSGRIRDRRRWEAGLPSSGLWYPLRTPAGPEDLLAAQDLDREKIRILLERYGVLSRPLVRNEQDGWHWKDILPLLRIMELSGEVLSGYFFEDLPAPQFISHRGFRLLRKRLPEDRMYWMNAIDPASPCGLSIQTFEGKLPRRMPSNHLVFKGNKLLMVSIRNGKELRIYFEPDSELGTEPFSFFKVLLSRDFQPIKRISVETINGTSYKESPFLPLLEKAGFRRGVKGMVLF